MKALVALSTLVFASAIAQAEPKIAQFVAECDNTKNIREFLSKQYQETPFAAGMGIIQSPNNKFVEGRLMIWANPQNFSFTVTIEFDNDKSCILGSGQGLSPAYKETPT